MHGTQLLLLAAGLVPAQAVPAGAPRSVDGSAAGSALARQAFPENVQLNTGRSVHLPSPWPVLGASLTDAQVADVQVLTPRLVVISGRTSGTTDVVIWGKEEDQLTQVRVDVAVDLSPLQSELGALFPSAEIRASQSQNMTVVSGTVLRAEQARQLHDYLEGLEIDYLDMTSLPGTQQVQVKVRMAEVSRTCVRSLGVNGFTTGDDFFLGSTVGSSTGGAINPISIGPAQGTSAEGGAAKVFTDDVLVSPAVTLFGGTSELEIFLQALEENQYLRILAEPNLVALSGEKASFLAGGEFPIPVVQGGGAGSSTSVTIEYKEFGVGLSFSPVVLGDGSIRLQIFSEVSDLTDIGAVEIEGFRIPAIVTRRAETVLELDSGQTFAMAGLINETAGGQASKIPGLGSLPVLGALFRSSRYRKGETELLVLVTAALVEPLSDVVLLPLPGSEHLEPSDWELFAEGRLEGRAPDKLPFTAARWLDEMQLDRLQGPGAWASHELPPAPSRSLPGTHPPQPERAAKEAPAEPPGGKLPVEESSTEPEPEG